jgi:hypothetical protein
MELCPKEYEELRLVLEFRMKYVLNSNQRMRMFDFSTLLMNIIVTAMDYFVQR